MPSTSVSPKTAAFTACSALGSVTSENEHLHQSFWHTCCWVESDFGVWVFVCLCILKMRMTHMLLSGQWFWYLSIFVFVYFENEQLHQSFWHTCCWVESDFGIWVFVCLCVSYFEIEQLHQINQYDTLCHWHMSYCWSDIGWHAKSVRWDRAILINNKKTSQRATNLNTFIPLLWPRLMIQSLADDSIWGHFGLCWNEIHPALRRPHESSLAFFWHESEAIQPVSRFHLYLCIWVFMYLSVWVFVFFSVFVPFLFLFICLFVFEWYEGKGIKPVFRVSLGFGIYDLSHGLKHPIGGHYFRAKWAKLWNHVYKAVACKAYFFWECNV